MGFSFHKWDDLLTTLTGIPGIRGQPAARVEASKLRILDSLWFIAEISILHPSSG